MLACLSSFLDIFWNGISNASIELRVLVSIQQLAVFALCVYSYDKKNDSSILPSDVILNGITALAVVYPSIWSMWVVFPCSILAIVQFMKKGFKTSFEA